MVAKQLGLTLVEVLVALLVTAFISAISFNAIQSATTTQTVVQEQGGHLHSLQRFSVTWTDDLEHLIARPIVDEFGVSRLALEAYKDAEVLLEFTRSGRYRNPNLPISSLERVEYRLEGDKLKRSVWLWLDRLEPEPTYEAIVLEGIDEARLVFYRKDQVLRSQDEWTQNSIAAADEMPLGIELIIEHEVYGEVRRLVAF